MAGGPWSQVQIDEARIVPFSAVLDHLVHCVIDLAPGESDGKDRHIST